MLKKHLMKPPSNKNYLTQKSTVLVVKIGFSLYHQNPATSFSSLSYHGLKNKK
jgi:hypothetical protein